MRFLLADSRMLYSKEMEHLKNISENIWKVTNMKNFPTQILKNWIGQFRFTGVSSSIQTQTSKEVILKRNVEKSFTRQNYPIKLGNINVFIIKESIYV